MGDFSRELCGGTHLAATGEIGVFKIVSEASSASGIRRIEALAGEPAFSLLQKQAKFFNDILSRFNQKAETIGEFLAGLESRLKERERQIKKISHAPADSDEIIRRFTVSASPAAVVAPVETIDAKELAALADEIKNKNRGLVVLFSSGDERSQIVISLHKDLTSRLDANIMVKKVAAMVHGKGGGRKDFAQAGGERIADPERFRETVGAMVRAEL